MLNLTLHDADDHHAITRYDASGITVGERHFEVGVVVHPEREAYGWSVEDVAGLTVEAVEQLLAGDPDVVILGTGARQVFPSGSVLRVFADRGVGCEVMDSGAACRTYNVLASEARDVVAAIMPLRV